jgi:Na+(H+)/acetate symporter ActP
MSTQEDKRVATVVLAIATPICIYSVISAYYPNNITNIISNAFLFAICALFIVVGVYVYNKDDNESCE